MKHTQGEWILTRNTIMSGDTHIANTSIGRADTPYIQIQDEEEANAKLIAAAPDLLEAILAMQELSERISKPTEKEFTKVDNMLKAAIKKATS